MRLAIATFIIITEIVFLYFMSSAGIEYVLSSVVLSLAVLLQLCFGIRKDAAVPADIVAFIFSWLFLDLTSKIQLLSSPRLLVNTSSVVASGVLITNLICAVFIVAFTATYALVHRPLAMDAAADQPDPEPRQAEKFTPFGICLLLAICLVVVAILGRKPYQGDATLMAPITSSDLVIKKFLLFMPSAALLIYLSGMIQARQKWVFSSLCVLSVLILLVALTENPLTEKRHALGPVYLGLLFVVFRSKLRGLNGRFLLLVASMVLIFPAISVMTHSHRQFLHGVQWSAVVETLKDHYFSVNYDAWANTYTIVEMVGRQGLGWGHQLLGDFLFFVPSSVWHAKPLATGITVGNYLILHHGGWFTNLSAPLPAEGYYDFGTLGAALYGVVLAIFVEWLNRLAADDSKAMAFPLAVYGSLYLMFALRGSLMIAFAYGAGALLAFLVASSCLSIGGRRIGQRYFRTDDPSLSPDQRVSGLTK
jgi:hypothetical protein